MITARPAPALLALALLAGCAGPRPAPPPFPGATRVDAVALRGCVQLACDELRTRLLSRPGAWFDPALWEDDLRRIVRAYHAEGYYDAAVLEHGEEVGPTGVTLRASVREGAPTALHELLVRGLDALPPEVRDDVLDGLALRAGDRFREVAWNRSKDAILERLREHGFATPDLRSEARVDPELRAANALLDVTPGPRYRFGPVTLTTEAPPALAEAAVAEARAFASPDAWFSPTALAEAQRRVFGLGAFDAVSVATGAPDPARGVVPVLVSVSPAPDVGVRGGAGLGLSTDRSDAHLLGEVRLPHALGGLRQLGIRAQAGWAVVPGAIALASSTSRVPTRGAPVARAALDLVQPRFLGTDRLDLFAGVQGELGLYSAYRVLSALPRVGLGWALSPSVELQLAYVFRVQHVFDTPLLPDLSGGPSAYGCASPCTLSAVQLLARYDTFRAEEPRRGERGLLRVRQAGGPWGGAHAYLDVRAEGLIERPWGRRGADGITLRLTGGGLFDVARDAVPVTERLSGGGLEMRGFGDHHLSPQLLVPLRGEVASYPVGGRGLLEASLELEHAVGEALGVALFADAGAVSVEPFDPGRLVARLLYAVGAGLRYRSPLGPVRLDLAYRLPLGPPLPAAAAPGAPPAVTAPGCFGVGSGGSRAGAPESPCTVHISIGEAW